MTVWRLLIPAALVVLVLAQAATALHWFGLGDTSATTGAPSRPVASPLAVPPPLAAPNTDRGPAGR